MNPAMNPVMNPVMNPAMNPVDPSLITGHAGLHGHDLTHDEDKCAPALRAMTVEKRVEREHTIALKRARAEASAARLEP